MNKSEEALNTFTTGGFNCAQSVFSTFCEQLGLDKETALKIACSFGGGMGHTGQTCGAVTGAFMLIGLKKGQFKADDKESKEKTYALVEEFAAKFKALHGSISCKDLLGYDMSIPEEFEKVRESGLTKIKCPQYIQSSIKLIEDILLQEL
jgi:C_GCAxxG_C_C family probable redox protein